MTTEGNPVHQKKRGPGRCVIRGETWTDRFVKALVYGKQNFYYLCSKGRRRSQASEKKWGMIVR